MNIFVFFFNVFVQVLFLDWVVVGKLVEFCLQILVEDVFLFVFVDLGSGDFFVFKVQGILMDWVLFEGLVIVVNCVEWILINGGFYVFWLRSEGMIYKCWYGGDLFYFVLYFWDVLYQFIFVKKKCDLEIVGWVKRILFDLQRLYMSVRFWVVFFVCIIVVVLGNLLGLFKLVELIDDIIVFLMKVFIVIKVFVVVKGILKVDWISYKNNMMLIFCMDGECWIVSVNQIGLNQVGLIDGFMMYLIKLWLEIGQIVVEVEGCCV